MLFKSIALSADHAGFPTKEVVKNYLLEKGIEVKDFGTYSESSTDYADYAHPMAEAVESGTCEIGFAMCGSGNGINMTVNKHQQVRAALCWTTEIASLARLHNNANVCSIPARFITEAEAIAIVEVFLTTQFEGGRHQARIDKIALK